MRLGNGFIAELIEWACRTYGWRIDYVVSGAPAVQLAMLYRCFAQGPGGVKSGTLLEDELAASLWGGNGKFAEVARAVIGGQETVGVG